MSDHPVIVPTEVGPVGAVVSEPDAGPRRGALALLQGAGPPCRAGVNRVWAKVARRLAELGLVVLRFDFACEGESTSVGGDVPREEGWRRSADIAILRRLAPWFLERTGERELMVAGSCHGARVALEFAAAEPAARGLFLVVPYLWHREPHQRAGEGLGSRPALDGHAWAAGPTLDTDRDIEEGFRACLSRGPVWALVGAREAEQVRPFQRRTAASADRALEIEVVSESELHPVTTPAQQVAVRQRLVARIGATLTARNERVPLTS